MAADSAVEVDSLRVGTSHVLMFGEKWAENSHLQGDREYCMTVNQFLQYIPPFLLPADVCLKKFSPAISLIGIETTPGALFPHAQGWV